MSRSTLINGSRRRCDQVGFTVFFDLEVLVKVWCMGFSTYWNRSIHKFEAVLAVGSTLHLLPTFYNSAFTYFQVSDVSPCRCDVPTNSLVCLVVLRRPRVIPDVLCALN